MFTDESAHTTLYVEHTVRQNDRASMIERGQNTKNAPKAVMERNGNTNAIVRRVLEALADRRSRIERSMM
jgi:hypothetical protein